MKERPILFSGPMVRAILSGAKTQTRRVVKFKPHPLGFRRDDEWHAPWRRDNGSWCFVAGFGRSLAGQDIACPYGQHGDRLWVRETFADASGAPLYQATNPLSAGIARLKWRPSIHMPRSYSRITLEVMRVRPERLKQISEADSKAEGVDPVEVDATDQQGKPVQPNYALGFAFLWDAINADRGFAWDSNPWVWLIEFRRVTT